MTILSFDARVTRAITYLESGIFSVSRQFDACFEQGDGAEVIAAIVRLAAHNGNLAVIIAGSFPSWPTTAARFKALTDTQLEQRAKRIREATK